MSDSLNYYEKYKECIEDLECCYYLVKRYLNNWEILTLTLPIVQMTCNNLIEFFKEFSARTSYFTNGEFASQYRVGYKIFTDIKDIEQRYSKLLAESLENNAKSSKCYILARLIADNYCVWFINKFPILNFSLSSHLHLLNSESINLYNKVEAKKHGEKIKQHAKELAQFMRIVLNETNIEYDCETINVATTPIDYRVINRAKFIKGERELYEGLFLLDVYCVCVFYLLIIKEKRKINDHMFWDKIAYYLFFNLYIGIKNNCRNFVDKYDIINKYDRLIKNKIRSSIAHYKCLSKIEDVVYESFYEAIENELSLDINVLNEQIDKFFNDIILYCDEIFNFN